MSTKPATEVNLLCLDVGLTTGIATFDESETLLETWALRPPELNTLSDWSPKIVVAELPLLTFRGRLAYKLNDVSLQVRKLFPKALLILASQWKPTTLPEEIFRKRLTPHEKDAIMIGRWYFRYGRALKEI